MESLQRYLSRPGGARSRPFLPPSLRRVVLLLALASGGMAEARAESPRSAPLGPVDPAVLPAGTDLDAGMANHDFVHLSETSITPLLVPSAGPLAKDPGVDGPFPQPLPVEPEDPVAPEAAQAATDPEQSPWAASFELYGYLPISTIGTSTIKGLETDFDIPLPALLETLRFAASARGSIEYGRFGLLGDLYYVNVGDEAAKVVGKQQQFEAGAEVGLIQGIYDLALRYRFGDRESAIGEPGQFTIIPYGGVRILHGDIDISATLAGQSGLLKRSENRSFQRTWAQPMIGTQASVFLTPRLKTFLRVDLAGFDLAGEQDFSANAQLGLSYAVGNSTTLNVSWRYLALEWDNGARETSAFTSYQHGIEAGLKFFF